MPKVKTEDKMYSAKSYLLTKGEYNYLRPVLKTRLLTSGEKHYLIADFEQLRDDLNRLKGLYDYYDKFDAAIIYCCSMKGSLERFRNQVIK